MRLPAIFSVTLAAGLAVGAGAVKARAQGPASFDGIQVNLGNLFRTSQAQTRSISAENFTGFYWDDETEPHAKFPPLLNKAGLAIKPISVAPPAPPAKKPAK